MHCIKPLLKPYQVSGKRIFTQSSSEWRACRFRVNRRHVSRAAGTHLQPIPANSDLSNSMPSIVQSTNRQDVELWLPLHWHVSAHHSKYETESRCQDLHTPINHPTASQALPRAYCLGRIKRGGYSAFNAIIALTVTEKE